MDVLDDWLRVLGTTGVLLTQRQMPLRSGVRIPPRDDTVFHIVTEGECWLHREGADAIQLLQGDIVLLPRGLAHVLHHDPVEEAEPLARVLARTGTSTPELPSASVVSGFYKMDARLAKAMLRSLPPVVHFTALRVREHPALSTTVTLLTSELDRPGPGSDALVQNLLDALFVYLNREWSVEAQVGGFSWLTALGNAPLSRALGRMHAAPSAPWTVETLARVAKMSRATFARRFTLYMGEPPLGYLTRWRMILAAKMLSEGDISVAEVAGKVGYDSEFAFSRAFKRHRGSAPTAFRRGSNLPAAAPGTEPEMATVMAPDADREYVSVFDASGIAPTSRPHIGLR